MENHELVEILFADGNTRDAELTMRALKRGGLANALLWVKDGQQAMDFNAMAELARHAGYYWLAVNKTPSH